MHENAMFNKLGDTAHSVARCLDVPGDPKELRDKVSEAWNGQGRRATVQEVAGVRICNTKTLSMSLNNSRYSLKERTKFP